MEQEMKIAINTKSYEEAQWLKNIFRERYPFVNTSSIAFNARSDSIYYIREHNRGFLYMSCAQSESETAQSILKKDYTHFSLSAFIEYLEKNKKPSIINETYNIF